MRASILLSATFLIAFLGAVGQTPQDSPDALMEGVDQQCVDHTEVIDAINTARIQNVELKATLVTALPLFQPCATPATP